MEHRWGGRVVTNLNVRISGASIAGAGVLRNLSSSGAYIETALPIASLTMVRVQIPRNRSGQQRTDAWALVVRQDRDGVGIEWCDAAPIDARILTQRSESSNFAVASSEIPAALPSSVSRCSSR